MSLRRSFAGDPILGLGSRIKSAREQMGWTQTELGRAVGVSKSAVSQWEKGAVQNLRLGNLFRTAEVLQQDIRALVFGSVLASSGVADGAPPYSSVPPQRLALLRNLGKLPQNVQAMIGDLVETLAKNEAG